MNNKFALSFGIALIIVGILNNFMDTNNIVIFALTICTSIFSLINIIVTRSKFKKNIDLLYIIPFVLLLLFFCYDEVLIKYDVVLKIVEGKTTSILTFISFGFLFVSEYFNYRYEILNQKVNELKKLTHDYEYSNIILALTTSHMIDLKNKGIAIDDESESFLDKICDLCNEKTKLSNINIDLLELNKDNYDIEDFDKIYTNYNEKINHNKIVNDFKLKVKNDNKNKRKKKKTIQK